MSKIGCLLIPLLVVVSLSADVKNVDKPKKGVWDFELEEIWQIKKAGGDVFGRPFSLLVSEEEHVYIYDAGNDINYIFDGDGRFMKAFAPAGQGPGEIQGQGLSFVVDEKVIIDSMGSLHYFSGEGEYIKSLKKDTLQYDPHIFLSANECITAPLTMIHMSDGNGEIQRLNLGSEEKSKIATFSVFEEGVARSGDQVVDVIVPGLTPTMTMAYSEGRLYWGMNNSYVINISGLDGKKLGVFEVKRKKTEVSGSFKKKYFTNENIPPDMLKQLVDSLPNKISCFHRIDLLEGFVYVYVPELELGQKWPKIKQIDIFSPEGEYLYKAQFEFGKDLKLLFSPLYNFKIKGENLYVVLTDTDDNVLISKYRINLPIGSR
ncbi:MAG: hypothetical protein JSV17_01655 [Candidatus Aminicenantes bacterium]|nr:MAG: hypothetical protein JSV17_01655 [Candidatus Aminicenantes bacterium]